MTGLLDCVVDNVPVTVMILDNGITGMTGSQKSSATGRIESICQGIGVDPEHIRVINPLPSKLEENIKVIQQELEYQGVSVIIPRRECIVWANKKRKMAKKAK
jgi:indolepyruvate ferredoxin oxidoreductase alpha subunit